MTREEHLLVCLIEELAEVQQELSKCLRFGQHHTYHKYNESNLERVRLEMTDVQAISMHLLSEGVDIGYFTRDEERFIEKEKRTSKLMDFATELKTLEYWWECKYCGLSEEPRCNKCVRNDGRLVEDELIERSD